MRRGWLILSLAGMLAAPPVRPAFAQPDPDGNLQASTKFPDVYLNDSFDANDALRRAKRLESSGRWAEAARAYRHIATDFGTYLVRVADDGYVNVAEHVNRQLAAWPDAGLDAYQALYEQHAAARLEEASERRDLQELLTVIETYFCTDAAAHAADLAAQIALERGDFSLAISVYEKLLARHPMALDHPQELTVKLAVAYIWAGKKTEARALLEPLARDKPDLRIGWKDREVPPGDLLKLDVPKPATTGAQADTFTWPTYGGGATRNRQPASTVQAGAPLWTFDQFEPIALLGSSGKSADESFRLARRRGKFLSFQPVVANGLVYFHDSQTAWALNAVSGNLAWEFRLPASAGSRRRGAYDSAPPRLYTCTVDGGRLYVRSGDHDPVFHAAQVPQSGTLLLCLDALTGELIWKLDRTALSEKQKEIHLDGSPLAHGGKLYTVARRTRPFGFEDCYLLQIDARTGKIDWQTHLASASIGGHGYPQPTLTYPAIAGDTVLVHTNLGAIAAVATHNGQVRWLRLYSRRSAPGGRTRRRRSRKAIYPWHYNPTLCFRDRLVVCPLDSDQLLVLRQADGKIVRQIDKQKLHDVDTLLGVIDKKLYGLGSQVFAYDLEAGDLVWSKSIPDVRPYGRGFLTRRRIYVSVAERQNVGDGAGALLIYDLQGNLLHEKKWNDAAEGGNLLVTGEQLIVAGDHHVSAYASKEEVFARLKRRIEAAPEDPTPLLDLAEIAFRTRDYSQAIDALEKAVQRVGGLVQLSDPKLKRRVYEDAMRFADFLAKLDPPQFERAIELYLRAAQCPPDTRAHVEYRTKLAEVLQKNRRHAEAVAYYQQILLDPALRDYRGPDGHAVPAGQRAEKQVAELIQVHGREVYARFDGQARSAYLLARDNKDSAALRSVADSFPNSLIAPEALIERAGLLRKTGKPRLAARTYHQVLTRYPDLVDAPELIRRIADAYFEAGKKQSAAAWLRKGAREYPHGKVTVEGQRLTFDDYRAALLGEGAVGGLNIPKIRPVDPKPAYTREFDANIQVLRPLFQSPHVRWDILLVFYDSKIEAFRVRDNKALWPKPVACPMTPALIGFRPGRAILATKHQIFAVDLDAGRIVWRFGKYPADLDEPDVDPESFASWTVHTLSDDRLVSLQDSGLVTCLQADDGRLLWQVEPEHKPAEPMVVSEEFVIYRAPRQNAAGFPVLDVDTGKLLRIIKPGHEGGRPVIFLAVSPEGVLLIANSRRVSAFDPFNGKPLWTIRTKGAIREASLELGLDGFYLSEAGSLIRKRSFVDGRRLWDWPIAGVRAGGPRTRLVGDELLVSSNRDVVSLDADTGQELWTGLHDDNVNFKYQFLADPYFVAIDEQKVRGPDKAESEKRLTIYFYNRTGHSGKLAENGKVVLGGFSRLKDVYCYDNALIVLDGQTTLRAYTGKP